MSRPSQEWAQLLPALIVEATSPRRPADYVLESFETMSPHPGPKINKSGHSKRPKFLKQLSLA